jgi:hypothetical protein
VAPRLVLSAVDVQLEQQVALVDGSLCTAATAERIAASPTGRAVPYTTSSSSTYESVVPSGNDGKLCSA